MVDMPMNREDEGVGIRRRSAERGIFGNGPNLEARFIENHEQLAKHIEALKTINQSIVLTSGTFDMLHIGHARYLEVARSYGDILVVGVDSDAKVRARKGPERPIVPQVERIETLAHLKSVDVITLKQPDEPRWELIKTVRPDTLVVTRETYDDSTIKQLEEYCGQVVCLEPQATTSTSAKIRKLQISWASEITDPVMEILDEHEVPEELRRKIGRVLNGGRFAKE